MAKVDAVSSPMPMRGTATRNGPKMRLSRHRVPGGRTAGHQVAPPTLAPRQRAHGIMGATEGRQPFRQIPRHLRNRARGPASKLSKTGRNRQEVLDPVAHFASEKFTSFFCLFSTCDVEKDAKHQPFDDALVGASATSGYPAHTVINQDAEVDLIEPGTERVALKAARTLSRSAG